MSYLLLQADARRLPLADRSVDLVIGSPPYLDARTYGIGAQRGLDEWVAWMLEVTAEALRVSRGLVLWVCAGVTRDWCYQPGPEGLLYEHVRRGGVAWRPCYWRRVGIPGSGGPQWYRFDVEYALAFARERGTMPYGEPTANGSPPKCGPGGPMSNRLASGERIAGYSINMTSRRGRNDRRERPTRYPSHERYEAEGLLCNPGNLIDTGAGGSANLGHALAHESEAPYPVAVPVFFIRSHCPPGGLVADPFGGSGTTAEAAEKEGRHCILLDIRRGRGALATAARRLARPHAPVPRGRDDAPLPLFAEPPR